MSTSVWTEQLPSGKWRVVWRNVAKQTPDGRPLKPKDQKAVGLRRTAEELAVKIRQEIDLRHYYVHEAPPELQIANLSQVAADFIVFKRDTGGAAPGTLLVYTSGFKRICATVRQLEGLPEKAPVPITLLTMELFTRLQGVWKRQVGAQRVYDLSLYLLAAWRWAASQPKRYPGIASPPHDDALVLPPAPVRVAAQEPRLAELDAVCRRAAAYARQHKRSLDLGLIVVCLRLTGLRIGQVLELRVRDVDLEARTLIVATGKSKREKAEQREVPIHEELLDLLRQRIAGEEPATLLFPPLSGEPARNPPDHAMRIIWREATDAKEVRESVWKPRNRGKTRTKHVFRAGFLAALRDEGVPAEVRHALVGHAAGSTEERHYSRVTLKEMREAIDKLPRIDWAGADGAPASTQRESRASSRGRAAVGRISRKSATHP